MKQDMTRGSIGKTLVAFTTPLILSGLLQQIFNWVDAFIVGNVEGELALTGIGATTSLYNLFVTVIVGFTSGISVLAGQQYGMGKREPLRGILSSFVALLGGVFLAAAALGIPLTGTILLLLDTPAEVFPISLAYMRILFLGIPCLAVYNTYSAVLRGMGDSRAPFLAVLVCSLANAALDLLFVAKLGLGAAGAAAATALSQGAMTVFVVLYAVGKYPVLRFRFGPGAVDRAVLARGLRFSLPPTVQSGVTSVGSLILQRFMNGFGEQTVAAITTAYRVDCVIILPIVNFGSGIATMVAQNIGAGNRERARRTLRVGSGMIAAVSLCLTALVLVFSGRLIAMFGLTAETVAIGVDFFRGIAVCYIVYGLAMAVRGYLEGTGDMLYSGLAGIVSLLVRIGGSYAGAARFGNRIIAYAEALAWAVLLALYLGRYWRNQRVEAARAEEAAPVP